MARRRRPRGRSSLALASRSFEVATQAPLVATLRIARVAVAGQRPRAADRAEAMRMTTEKYDAFWRAWIAMALRMHRLQLEWMLAAMRTLSVPFATAAGPKLRGASPAIARRRIERTMRELAHAALVPVHGTVTRNARRLSRKAR